MIRKILRLLNYIKLKSQNKNGENSSKEQELIPRSIAEIESKLKVIFTECSDFNLRQFCLGENSEIKLIIANIDGLVNKDLVNDNILRPVMIEAEKIKLSGEINHHSVLKILKENLLTNCELSEIKDFKKTVNTILSGDTIIFIDGNRTALNAGSRGWEQRGVETSNTESVVRGPREGFTETLRVNTSLLRRKIKSPKLKFETLTLGQETNTDIAISYIKGLAHDDVIDTVRRRLKRIKTDAILESGYIEEFIEDAPFSIFSTVANSEKPDIVAAKILEGRVAILTDGTPFVLTVPHLFIETLQASEDYYSRAFFSTLIRFLRIMALIISIITPAFYIALVSFHHNVIPFKLLLTIAASREGIAFSAFNETLLMALSYELLREAGVRMPRPIGQAVSIVGALVLGQAAVEAGIASNPVVILTAITAITSFILPPLGGTMPIIRLLLVIAANILGFMGMFLVLVAFLIHMATLRSFGVSYLAPFSPLSWMDLKDTFIRVPLWVMWTRPRFLVKKSIAPKYGRYKTKKDIRTKGD